jgi:cysteine desulfuration protein SufE
MESIRSLVISEHEQGKRMPLPAKLEKVVQRFSTAPRELKGQALLQFAKKVPPLPREYADDPNRLARVHECQSPFFLAVQVEDDGEVHLFFDCPPETPTVRGFAGIIREGLEGEHYSVVLDVPTTFYSSMGLEEVVSPMRLRGMRAIMAAIRRGIRSQIGDKGHEEG